MTPDIAILDFTNVISTITVTTDDLPLATHKSKVTDLEIFVEGTHPGTADLSLYLSKNKTEIKLLTSFPNERCSGFEITFNSLEEWPLQYYCQISYGNLMKPEESFAFTFRNTNPIGDWQFRIYDNGNWRLCVYLLID